MISKMDRDPGAGGHAQGPVTVTKCVTIRDFAPEDSSEPPEKWVNCFSVTSPTRQALCKPSDWELADTSHVLLYIDVPNQQPYHLPMLITPALCVYLITFDLRYQKESLSKIHSVMKNVYAISSFTTADGEVEFPPKVLLVGMHADKVEAEDRSLFTQELNRRLEKMPYNRLVERGGDEPFWAVDGGDLCLSGTDPLSKQIQSYGSRCQAEVHQWIMHHHELQEKLKDAPCIPYDVLKEEVANVSSDPKSLKFDEFLQFLHNYGFIVYRSVEKEEVADKDKKGESDKVVLLRPQYLCDLFAKVQTLSQKRDRTTIADLLSSTAACTESSAKHKKWFQRICIDLGLVFEVAKPVRSDYVFLMSLKPGPSSPPHDSYSVPPLLVTFKESVEAIEGECLLPSHFFAAFVTEFIRCPALTQGSRLQKPKQPKVESMEQHYMQVSIGSTYVHVVEREFCIEIGLQQLEVRGRSTSRDKMVQSLQSFCKRIRKAVTDAADNIMQRQKLTQSSLCYGFYHLHKTEDGPLDAFGEYMPRTDEEEPILQCSCCVPRVQPTTPLQEIWFEEKFGSNEVSIQTVSHPDGYEVRQLCVAPQVSDTPSSSDQSDGQSNIPSNPPCAPNGATAQPKQKEPGVPVDQVLGHFRKRFVEEVNANAIVFELVHEDIIADGDQKEISKKSDAAEQNQFLHAHLVKTCTEEALMTVCDVIISVKGNPKMRALGKDMKRMLEGSSEGATSK